MPTAPMGHCEDRWKRNIKSGIKWKIQTFWSIPVQPSSTSYHGLTGASLIVHYSQESPLLSYILALSRSTKRVSAKNLGKVHQSRTACDPWAVMGDLFFRQRSLLRAFDRLGHVTERCRTNRIPFTSIVTKLGWLKVEKDPTQLL